jgi:hypothetical protein
MFFTERVACFLACISITFLSALSQACNKDVGFKGHTADKPAPVVVLDQKFTAGVSGHDELNANPLFGQVEQKFNLLEKPPVVATMRQTERPLVVDEFTQGHDGTNLQESFTLSTAGKLDLLIVVDNSSSMEKEQINLASKLSSLTKYLKTSDWQIAVVTTDDSCLRESRVIKRSDPDADQAFATAINAGISGSSNERGILQAIRAFKGLCSTGNKTWLRPDAAAAVFFVSDEQSYCSRRNCKDGDGPDDLIAYMNGPQMNRGKDKLKAYALLWNDQTDSSCTKDSEKAEEFGSRYSQVVNEFNPNFGYGSICADDYTPVLERISKDVSRLVKSEFVLKYEPLDDSVVIAVDGQAYTDFEVSGKEIKVKNIPGDSINMKVTYATAPTPKYDRFTLKKNADVSTVEAFVNNQKIDATKLSYDESSRELFFVEMPANDAKVKIKYRDDTPLTTLFNLGTLAIRGPLLEVKVAGQVVNEFEYDEALKVLMFVAAPLDGEEVQVTYKGSDGRITHYAAAANLEKVQALEVKDAETGELIAAELESKDLVFAEDEVKEGRSVVAIFDYGDSEDALTFELSHEPLEGSLKVVRADGNNACIKNIVLEEKSMRFDCADEQLGTVVISYDYLALVQTSFDTEAVLPEEGVHWQVFVDGAAVDFTRSGSVITVDEALVRGESEVRVIATQEQ